jgi:hypothetical protein
MVPPKEHATTVVELAGTAPDGKSDYDSGDAEVLGGADRENG